MTYYIGPKSDYSDSITYCTIEEAYEYLKDKMEIGIDIETTRKYPKGTYSEEVYIPGLDPYVSKIVMLQIGTLERVYVIDVRCTNISVLLPLFEDRDRLWVGMNLKFECRHLGVNYGIRFYNIWDVMLVELNLYNGLPIGFSLEAMSKRYLDSKSVQDVDLFSDFDEDEMYIDKSTRMQFSNIGDRLFTEKQILYGVGDIINPLKIRDFQRKGRIIGEEIYSPVFLHGLENKFCIFLAEMENRGIPFNPDKWVKVAEEK